MLKIGRIVCLIICLCILLNSQEQGLSAGKKRRKLRHCYPCVQDPGQLGSSSSLSPPSFDLSDLPSPSTQSPCSEPHRDASSSSTYGLPSELWVEIFSYFATPSPDIKTLGRLARSCHYFKSIVYRGLFTARRELTDYFQKPLQLNRLVRSHGKPLLLGRHLESLSSLDLSNSSTYHHKQIFNLLCWLPKLTAITQLTLQGGHLNQNAYNKLRYLIHLKELEIRAQGSKPHFRQIYLSDFNQLTNLELLNLPYLVGYSRQRAASSAPSHHTHHTHHQRGSGSQAQKAPHRPAFFPHLRKLQLKSGLDEPICPAAFIRKAPMLTSLYLGQKLITRTTLEVIASLKHLDTLYLSNVPHNLNHHLKDCLIACSERLKSLKLKKAPLSIPLMNEGIQACRKLSVLHFIDCFMRSDEHAYPPFSSFNWSALEALQEVCFDNACITDQGIHSLFMKAKALKVLRVSNCGFIFPNKVLSLMSETRRQLSRLTVSNECTYWFAGISIIGLFSNQIDASLDAFAPDALESLTHFQMNQGTLLNANQIFRIIAVIQDQCKALTHLNLSGTSLDNEGLKIICKMPNLKSLRLSHCMHLSAYNVSIPLDLSKNERQQKADSARGHPHSGLPHAAHDGLSFQQGLEYVDLSATSTNVSGLFHFLLNTHCKHFFLTHSHQLRLKDFKRWMRLDQALCFPFVESLHLDHCFEVDPKTANWIIARAPRLRYLKCPYFEQGFRPDFSAYAH